MICIIWILSKYMSHMLIEILLVAAMVLLLLTKTHLQDSKPKTSTADENIDYWLPPPLTKRLMPVSWHSSPVQFWQTLTHPKTKTKTMNKVHHATGSAKLDCQIEEDWGDNCHIPPQQTHKPTKFKPDCQTWQVYAIGGWHTGHNRQ